MKRRYFKKGTALIEATYCISKVWPQFESYLCKTTTKPTTIKSYLWMMMLFFKPGRLKFACSRLGACRTSLRLLLPRPKCSIEKEPDTHAKRLHQCVCTWCWRITQNYCNYSATNGLRAYCRVLQICLKQTFA